MNKLLKAAQNHPVRSGSGITSITDDHIEVTFAYLKGTITLTQAAFGFGHKEPGNATYAVIVRSIKKACEKGLLKIPNSKS